MILDKSLTAKLSRMTHSCRANASSVGTLDGRGADTVVCTEKKTVETGCMWILIITAAGFQRMISLWEVIIILLFFDHIQQYLLYNFILEIVSKFLS